MPVKCNKCGTECGDQAKFCNNCGNKVQDPTCPNCAKPMQPEDRFCGSCGNPIASGEPPQSDSSGGQYDGPWRLTDVVRAWLKEMEWDDEPELDNQNGKSSTSLSIGLEDYSVKVFCEVVEPIEVFQLFMYYFDLKITPKRIGAAREFVEQVNLGMLLGQGQIPISEDVGTLRYLSSVDVEQAAFEPRHISNMLFAAETFMKKRIPQIESICKGKSPADVLSEE